MYLPPDKPRPALEKCASPAGIRHGNLRLETSQKKDQSQSIMIVPGSGLKCLLQLSGKIQYFRQKRVQICVVKNELIPSGPRSVTPNSFVFDNITGSVRITVLS